MGGRELLPVKLFLQMIQLFDFFSLLILISTIMCIMSFNPIHSIFWLVFIFLNSSGFLISLGLDFIPLMIIIIYVIMMIDIIQLKEITSINNIIPILVVISVNIILQLLFIFKERITFNNSLNLLNWTFENLNQVHLINNIIYSDYFYLLLLISILLLIAMIGTIVLTLELGLITKRQSLSIQHQRNNSWI